MGPPSSGPDTRTGPRYRRRPGRPRPGRSGAPKQSIRTPAGTGPWARLERGWQDLERPASGGGVLGVPARGEAHDALEVPGEVRLVVEARLRGGQGDRLPGPQQGLGAPHPDLRLVRMRRHPYGLPEDPAQV